MRTQELTHIIRERYAKTRDLWQRARLIADIGSCRLLGEALSRGIEGGEDYAKSYILGVMNDSLPVAAKLKGLPIATCAFANLPERKRTQWGLTREEMKNCVWLEPKGVVQIEFGEWMPDRHLRHSKFITLRNDKDPRAVVRAGIT